MTSRSFELKTKLGPTIYLALNLNDVDELDNHTDYTNGRSLFLELHTRNNNKLLRLPPRAEQVISARKQGVSAGSELQSLVPSRSLMNHDLTK